MKSLQLWMIGLLLGCVCSVVEAGAAAKVTATQLSEGVYSVTVANVVKSALLEFTISYDGATLSNPVIANGPFATAVGAIQTPHNDSKSGILRVAYVVTAPGAYFDGSGLLATVTFTKTGSGLSRAPLLNSGAVSADGSQPPVQSIVVISDGASPGTGSGGSVGDAKTGGGTSQNSGREMWDLPGRSSTTGSVSTGMVSTQFPTSGTTLENKSHPDDNSLPEHAQETPPLQQGQQDGAALGQDAVSVAAADPADKAAPKNTADISLKNLKSLESVAERFRAYKGTRTLKGFSELFDNSKFKSAGVIQAPAIAVSDGKKQMSVKVSLPADSVVPSFSLKGANLKSIKNLSSKMLELDALPQKGKLDVRLTIVMQKEVAEIPLLVVPPISADILKLSDQDLEKLLSKPDAKNKTLPYDLNSDGKQDYLDDYILAAHWLLRQPNDKKTSATKTVAPR